MASTRLRRRGFLGSAATSTVALLGCEEAALDDDDSGTGGSGGSDGTGGAGGGSTVECADPFAGAQMLEQLAFTIDDGQPIQVPFHTKLNQGWDARLYTDLTQLDADRLVTPTELFYIRTEFPDLLVTTDDWQIAVSGLATPRQLTMADLLPLVKDQGMHVLECSGNGGGGGFGLMSAASWAGAPVEEVMALIDVDPSATRVLIGGFDEHSVPSAGGHSTPGAAWIFTMEELTAARAFFATEMNGAALNDDHGKPVRLYVPNWYGCTCIKWVNEIVLLDEDAPATAQMQEFASRTHQSGTPQLARQYRPATMDQTAMPTRVEKWLVDGAITYRFLGIMWGGYELAGDALRIDFGDGTAAPVDVCPTQSTNQTWTLWEHLWRPTATGLYKIRMSIADPDIPTYRLDRGWYEREVTIDEI